MCNIKLELEIKNLKLKLKDRLTNDDIGKLYSDGSFEVLGRIDNSDIRGCSLMVV